MVTRQVECWVGEYFCRLFTFLTEISGTVYRVFFNSILYHYWLLEHRTNPYFTNDPIFRSFALKRSSTRILGTSVTLQHSWKQYHTLPDKPFSGQNCGHHTSLAVIGWPGRQYCRQNCGSSHTISLEIKIIRRRLRCICTRQGSNTLCLWPNDYAR